MLPEVICLGAVNVDLVYRVDDLAGLLDRWGTGLNPGGEEALTRDGEARLQDLLAGSASPPPAFGGGQAANTAYALARMGVAAALVGRVGADADGDFLKESLAGVNLDYLVGQAKAAGPISWWTRRASAPSWWPPTPTTTCGKLTCPGRPYSRPGFSTSPLLRETAPWRCSGR